MLETGLRLGEATALRPQDLSLDAQVPVCRIDKAWKQDGVGGWLIGPPKTKRSRRTVALAASTVALLRPLAAATNPEGYLFPATYDVEPDQTAPQILKMMVDQFATVAAAADRRRTLATMVANDGWSW